MQLKSGELRSCNVASTQPSDIWAENRYIDCGQSNGNFGFSVAISGTTVVGGAPGETASSKAGAGNAYVIGATASTAGSSGSYTNGSSLNGGNTEIHQ